MAFMRMGGMQLYIATHASLAYIQVEFPEKGANTHDDQVRMWFLVRLHCAER